MKEELPVLAAVRMDSLRASTHASRTSAAMSAPLKPLHLALMPMDWMSTPGAKGVFRTKALRIAARPSGGGSGTYRILSSRPGRSRAGSIMSGLFVAATKNTPSLPSMPSISVSSWFTTLSAAWLLSVPLRGANASSSSKNRTQGWAARARENSCRTARSLSPTYLFSSSGPLMDMKFAPLSCATALATKVLPQPGGPYSSTPVAEDRPRAWKRSGCITGWVMQKDNSSRTSSSDPTSSHVTSGVVAKPSRRTLGCTLLTAASKSDMVIARPCSS
mmetsp:Transcript_28567/g.77052  ORF Transcript_28567/g.77052 Transcript_28567/m.77052 type:complete len:275 (-) Transcript_28567:1339-2163(-)